MILIGGCCGGGAAHASRSRDRILVCVGVVALLPDDGGVDDDSHLMTAGLTSAHTKEKTIIYEIKLKTIITYTLGKEKKRNLIYSKSNFKIT